MSAECGPAGDPKCWCWWLRGRDYGSALPEASSEVAPESALTVVMRKVYDLHFREPSVPAIRNLFLRSCSLEPKSM